MTRLQSAALFFNRRHADSAGCTRIETMRGKAMYLQTKTA